MGSRRSGTLSITQMVPAPPSPSFESTVTAAAPSVRVTNPRAAGAVLFLSFVDVFALLPTVAPHVSALGAGAAGIGLAVGAYSALNLPANVVGGILVDRVGRRRVAIVGLVLAALTVAAYTLPTGIGAFIGVRALHGVAGGILVPAVFAAAGDRAGVGQAGRSFGRFGALIGAAAVIAPATAGAVRQVAGTDTVFLGVSALLLLGAVIAALGIHDRVPGATTDAAPPQRPMRALLRQPTLRRALAATIVLTAAVGALAAFLPGTAEALGASPSVVGGLFTAYAILAAGVMLSPVSGRVDRVGADGNAAAGLAVLAVALGLLVVTGQLWVAVLGSALFGAGYGLVFPAVTAATSLVSGTATRGRAFGLFNAAFSVGIALGPPTFGAVAQQVPLLDPLTLAAALCLVAAGWIAITHQLRPPAGPAAISP